MSILNKFILLLFCLILLIAIKSQVSALECYVCKNQENNKDKCVETVKTCDITEDRCLSEVRWGSTPYWAPTGEKQFYLSKRCASKEICNEAMRNVSRRCDRIWFNDWECIECCNGDRCNYFVTLGAPQLHFGTTLILTLVLSIFLIN